MKHSINRLSVSSRRIFNSHSHIYSISNGSRDNSSTRSQPVSISRRPFVTSAAITWNPGDLQWYTLLIDCSSRRVAHFRHWHICSISNGSRDNSSTRSQGVYITRQQFITSATITWDNGELGPCTWIISRTIWDRTNVWMAKICASMRRTIY